LPSGSLVAWLDYLGVVDRESIARAERRRQALEAVEFERARATALRERLESIVAELDGPAIDEAVFAQLAPEDVAVVRPALRGDDLEPVESFEIDLDETETDTTTWLEEEVVRLQEEIASSERSQQAFERYLEALGGA
jgi:hypothetical protein